MFPQSPEQWAHFLGAVGVRASTAARWAEPFYAECRAERFSQGAAELDDYIAQALYECAMLERVTEDLHYSAARIRELGKLYGPGSRWGRAAATADELAGQPQALAEVLYGGRFGNGHPGDGWKYRGRGIPMLTFADNYARAGKLAGLPLLEEPERLEEPSTVVRVSLCWWEATIRDAWLGDDARIRTAVQGSSLGLDRTRKLAQAARLALAAA